jgi:hypothetical protein
VAQQSAITPATHACETLAVFGLLKRLRVRHQEKEQDLAAIAKARHEAERAGDEPEKTMADTVFETYDKFPDGEPV